MKKYEIELWTSNMPSSTQLKKLREYFKEMPIEEILAGLKFAKNRWTAKDAGVAVRAMERERRRARAPIRSTVPIFQLKTERSFEEFPL